MRIFAALLTASAIALQPAEIQPPPTRIVGSMSDLMVKMIYPTSDAVFYITTRTPKTR